MPGANRAEFYFISAMMFLILVLCVGAVYFFIKTYKTEMRQKAERRVTEQQDNAVTDVQPSEKVEVDNVTS